MTTLELPTGPRDDGLANHNDGRTVVDPDFAARAAAYLREEGLDYDAIVVALRLELDVPTPDAERLAAHAVLPTNSNEGANASWN